MSSAQGVATTWKELIDGRSSPDMLVALGQLRAALAEGVPNRVEALAVKDWIVAGLGIMRGSKVVRDAVTGLEPTIDRTLRSVVLFKPASEVALRYLSLLTTLECAGFLNAPYGGADPTALLEIMINDMADHLAGPEKHSVALACIAVGRNDVVAEAVGGGPLPAAIEPGQSFGFDVPQFVRYLAVAVATRAPAADVAPAWGAFASAFPRKLAAKTLGWPDLMWAGRIYYHLLEKRPVGEVIDAISELVHSA